jgi:hypothetical protein
MQSFIDCKSGWSKEPQWENNCVSFLPCFLLVLAYKYFDYNDGHGYVAALGLCLRPNNEYEGTSVDKLSCVAFYGLACNFYKA